MCATARTPRCFASRRGVDVSRCIAAPPRNAIDRELDHVAPSPTTSATAARASLGRRRPDAWRAQQVPADPPGRESLENRDRMSAGRGEHRPGGIDARPSSSPGDAVAAVECLVADRRDRGPSSRRSRVERRLRSGAECPPFEGGARSVADVAVHVDQPGNRVAPARRSSWCPAAARCADAAMLAMRSPTIRTSARRRDGSALTSSTDTSRTSRGRRRRCRPAHEPASASTARQRSKRSRGL